MRTLILFVLLSLSSGAFAHGGSPRVVGVEFFSAHPEASWLLTDNQGVFADIKDGFRWLCEDAIAPSAGLRGLQIRGELGERWWVATTEGLFESVDMGCDFRRASEPIGSKPLAGLWTTRGDVWLTATTSLDEQNDVYWSADEGLTWVRSTVELAGRVIRIVPSSNFVEKVFMHAADGLYRSDDGGRSFRRLLVGDQAGELPADVFINLSMSSTNTDNLLLAVSAGERTRIFRSEDGGDTWVDVFLIPEPAVEVYFDAAGLEALAYGLSGLTWRSQDAGVSWAQAPPMPSTLGCFRFGPNGLFWACADPYRGGPWVLAQSADFGRTWTPILDALERASERWDCGPNSRGTTCCRGLCPGDQDPVACGQPRIESLPDACDQPVGDATLHLDMGFLDGAPPRVDGDLPGEALDAGSLGTDISPRIEQASATQSNSGGCSTHSRRQIIQDAWLLLLVLLSVRRLHMG